MLLPLLCESYLSHLGTERASVGSLSLQFLSSRREFIESEHSTPEHISYPARIVDQILGLLKASTALYPPPKRTFGADFHVGFLERI